MSAWDFLCTALIFLSIGILIGSALGYWTAVKDEDERQRRNLNDLTDLR